MKEPRRCARFVRLSVVSLLSCGVSLIVPFSVHANGADARVVRVEEDWELVVNTPDENSAGPQIVCTISPYNHVDGTHATFELNHQNLPYFIAGGLQLQTWYGETPIDSRKFPNPSLLHHNDETVRWTQSMRLQDGKLTFEVLNGSSESWGSFGGQGYLRWSVATNLSSLESYSAAISQQHSGVSYGANRVTSLELKTVRLHMSDGRVVEHNVSLCVCDNHN